MSFHFSPTVPEFDPFALESNVRYYCRRMPAVFSRARNAEVWDEEGRRYIDFLSACGALNYGHNHPKIKRQLIDYIVNDGVAASMDLHTVAKRAFLRLLSDTILAPKNLDYVVQFPGPTGTNAVEAALKLARKVTKRRTIVSFTNAFHGMTLGALSATGSRLARNGAGVPLEHVHRLPFEGDGGAGLEVFSAYHHAVENSSSGLEPPAAFLVETVQGEGGLVAASVPWLQRLAEIARQLGSLLIVDDVQAGCGRTGTFFSFERAGLRPDIVCLAKSVSGYGLPMALVLIKPEFDQWQPGEHNGTFRGNNHAFVAAKAALQLWSGSSFQKALARRTRELDSWLIGIGTEYQGTLSEVGCGLMRGLKFEDPAKAQEIANRAIRAGLLVEVCGPSQDVLKIMPPLTIEREVLAEGLLRLEQLLRSNLCERREEWLGAA